jgi:hypothetical protein
MAVLQSVYRKGFTGAHACARQRVLAALCHDSVQKRHMEYHDKSMPRKPGFSSADAIT